MSKWSRKLNSVAFDTPLPCPYCKPSETEKYTTTLKLCQHVLQKHNWNHDFLKGFEIVETHGGVMIVKKLEKEVST